MLHQACLHRILIDVFFDSGKVALISDETVPVLRLPERPRASDLSIGLSTCKALPGTYDLAKRRIGHHSEQYVDVVWHHGPGWQTVPQATERQDRIVDAPCDRIGLQPTRTPAPIEHLVAQGLRPIGTLQALKRFGREAICEPERDELGVPALVAQARTLSLAEKTRDWSGAPPAHRAPASVPASAGLRGRGRRGWRTIARAPRGRPWFR